MGTASLFSPKPGTNKKSRKGCPEVSKGPHNHQKGSPGIIGSQGIPKRLPRDPKGSKETYFRQCWLVVASFGAPGPGRYRICTDRPFLVGFWNPMRKCHATPRRVQCCSIFSLVCEFCNRFTQILHHRTIGNQGEPTKTAQNSQTLP